MLNSWYADKWCFRSRKCTFKYLMPYDILCLNQSSIYSFAIVCTLWRYLINHNVSIEFSSIAIATKEPIKMKASVTLSSSWLANHWTLNWFYSADCWSEDRKVFFQVFCHFYLNIFRAKGNTFYTQKAATFCYYL